MIYKHFLIGFLLFFSFLVIGEEIKELEVIDSAPTKAFLEAWNINEVEYKRYQYIKNNLPRGYYTKAHPLYYLGIEARTDEERDKYAKAIAIMEYQNFEKVQAFSKRIQKYQFELFAPAGMIDMSSTKRRKNQSVGKSQLRFMSKLFVDSNCIAECSKIFKAELKRILAGTTEQLHVVFPRGTKPKDINSWAYKVGIPHELNEQNLIILRLQKNDENHNSFPHIASELL